MLEADPLAKIETETCRDALINQWVARFGVPAHLMSDQGAQFTSALWARLCDVIGTHHNTTTPYHPQSNGMVERAHRRLKDALKARMAAADWPQHLPWFLLDINNTPKEDTGKSAAQMVYGTSLTLPAQLASGDDYRWTRSCGIFPTPLRYRPGTASRRRPPKLPRSWQPQTWSTCAKATNCNPWLSPTAARTRYWREDPSTSAWTSDVDGTDNPSLGTISRTSSHYRSSPCAPAQSSQQIRPLSETKRSGGSDVATVK